MKSLKAVDKVLSAKHPDLRLKDRKLKKGLKSSEYAMKLKECSVKKTESFNS